MAGVQISPGEWKEKIRDCRETWRRMPEQQKEAYHAMAAEEQGLRQEAALQPFRSRDGPTSLGQASFDAASRLPKNALKTISKQRLLVTRQRTRCSDLWAEFESGLASPDGAMSLDSIDLNTTMEDMSSRWSQFVSAAKDCDDFGYDEGAAKCLHHSVCRASTGICRSMPCHDEACKFSASLHNLAKEGDWT